MKSEVHITWLYDIIQFSSFVTGKRNKNIIYFTIPVDGFVWAFTDIIIHLDATGKLFYTVCEYRTCHDTFLVNMFGIEEK